MSTKKVGVCSRYWLMWVRITDSIRLMETENHSTTEVAFASGFQDLRTFERAFKKCVGFCPSAFKGSVCLALSESHFRGVGVALTVGGAQGQLYPHKREEEQTKKFSPSNRSRQM